MTEAKNDIVGVFNESLSIAINMWQNDSSSKEKADKVDEVLKLALTNGLGFRLTIDSKAVNLAPKSFLVAKAHGEQTDDGLIVDSKQSDRLGVALIKANGTPDYSLVLKWDIKPGKIGGSQIDIIRASEIKKLEIV